MEKDTTHIKKLTEFYSCSDNGTRTLSLTELRQLLFSLCGAHTPLFIVIDAIDECTVAEERALLLSTLQTFHYPSIKILISGRPRRSDVLGSLSSCSGIDVRASDLDVQTYLVNKMRNNATFVRRIASADTLEKQIVTKITKHAAGM